jgi:N-methylhydantoinase B
MREHKLDSLNELSDEITGRTEAAMRAAIRELPDGVYSHTEISNGLVEPIVLKMQLTVAGGNIVIDFTGSAPQVQRGINICLAYTIAYASYGVMAALAPHVPNNEGSLRPIRIVAPEGSIVNSTPPAAGGARALIGHFLPMMVISALAQAIPDRVIATVGSPLWCINLAGVRPDGRSFANVFFANGGYGASSTRDGINVLSWPSNISSTPVEMMEQLAPLRVRYRRLRAGAGGRGKYRGGTGQEILLESRAAKPVIISFLAERTRPEAAPAGIAGGEAGAPGELLINGRRVDPKILHVVEPGGLIELKTPGGGGYGPASGRAPVAGEADALDGYA